MRPGRAAMRRADPRIGSDLPRHFLPTLSHFFIIKILIGLNIFCLQTSPHEHIKICEAGTNMIPISKARKLRFGEAK